MRFVRLTHPLLSRVQSIRGGGYGCGCGGGGGE